VPHTDPQLLCDGEEGLRGAVRQRCAVALDVAVAAHVHRVHRVRREHARRRSRQHARNDVHLAAVGTAGEHRVLTTAAAPVEWNDDDALHQRHGAHAEETREAAVCSEHGTRIHDLMHPHVHRR
jgi:hypothetical protein